MRLDKRRHSGPLGIGSDPNRQFAERGLLISQTGGLPNSLLSSRLKGKEL